jgi:phage shock protein A
MAKTAAALALATLPERVSVLETKVDNIEEKLDDIKIDVKEMHDCLDNTRDLLAQQLKEMSEASNSQHSDLYAKISEIEKSKDKLMLYGMVGAAYVAGAGWSGAINFPMILKFFGV